MFRTGVTLTFRETFCEQMVGGALKHCERSALQLRYQGQPSWPSQAVGAVESSCRSSMSASFHSSQPNSSNLVAQTHTGLSRHLEHIPSTSISPSPRLLQLSFPDCSSPEPSLI